MEMEPTDIDPQDLLTFKVPIDVQDTIKVDPASHKILPYFFIKYALDDKRYRISASFKYLNDKYGLHINIIRNLNKAENEGLNLKFIYCLLQSNVCSDTNIIKDLEFSNYKDSTEETEIFRVTRKWGDEISEVIVFFSTKWWSLIEYVNHTIATKEQTCQDQF